MPTRILGSLRACRGVSLSNLPGSSGVYALRDHVGRIRYIGIAHSEGFRVRIRNKHATGSEDRSHKFSAAYNAGRLWRDRHSGPKEDAAVSKRLRNRFILKHCSASFVEVEHYSQKSELETLEREVIQLARADEVVWNGKFAASPEPVELVDALIAELRLSAEEIDALERQRLRYLEQVQ